MDFLPDETEETLMAELGRRAARSLPSEELLTGMLHNRLGRVLMAASGVRGNRLCLDLTEEERYGICRTVKAFEVTLTEPMGMDSAQVTAGGVMTEEFCPETLQSHLVPGLYACGEVLDVDGDCGGYNLQWAWSSGYLAGKCAGGEEA